MASYGPKISQTFELQWLCQYLSKIIDQKIKMSQMLMAIFVAYSTSSFTAGKKIVATS